METSMSLDTTVTPPLPQSPPLSTPEALALAPVPPVPAAASSSGPCLLLSLPAELRDEIYGHVFRLPPSTGLRFEYGTAALVAPPEVGEHYYALRHVNRQLRAETGRHVLLHNKIVFDNLGSRIPLPNYRKYYNRWDTEFSEQRNLLVAAGETDVVHKPVEERVRSFLSRCSPAQIRLLCELEVVELRPLEHVSALFSVLDAFGCPKMRITLVIVPSVIGTVQFEHLFLDQIDKILASRWLKESPHQMRLKLEGFDGLKEWVQCEFPTNPIVQSQLRAQIAMLRIKVLKVNDDFPESGSRSSSCI